MREILRRNVVNWGIGALVCCCGSSSMVGAWEQGFQPEESAPPPAPPVVERESVVGPASYRPFGLVSAPYDVGPITGEEQLYIEFINRARRDPLEEGLRLQAVSDPDVLGAVNFFNTDLNVVLGDPEVGFAALGPAQPLAPNAALRRAALGHSQEMFLNTYQGHDGPEGDSVSERAQDQGYSFRRLGENVFSSARSVFHGHAGFQIDWGFGPNGIQDPPGHRNTIHNGLMREIGVGVFLGSKDEVPSNNPFFGHLTMDVGPQLVTQVLGSQLQDDRAFVTGVAYYDLNDNAFYDVGEGIEGLTVVVAGAPDHGVTAPSGGYAVPVPLDGTYEVRFEKNGVVGATDFAAVVNGLNAKVDFDPTYSGPVVSGNAVASVHGLNPFSISPIFAAEAYEWGVATTGGETVEEGGETGLDDFDTALLSDYSPILAGSAHTGSRSLYLTHTAADPRSQFLVWNRTFNLTEGARLRFFHRLARSTETQIAQVQIREAGGAAWDTLFERPGASPGDRTFAETDIDLAAYVGKEVQFRFNYLIQAGSFFPGTNSAVGFHLDSIAVSGVSFPQVHPVSGTEFQWTPPELGSFTLRARPIIAGRAFPWGPDFVVSSEDVPPPTLDVVLRFVSVEDSGGGVVTVRLESNLSLADVQLQAASSPLGPWAEVGRPLEDLGGGLFGVSAPVGSEEVFFRAQQR